LAYGQTGSGKTHTMMGPDLRNEESRGIIPRAIEDVFASLEQYDVIEISFFEILNEKIYDLSTR